MTPERMTLALQLMGLLTIAVCVIAVCGTVVATAALRKTEKRAFESLSSILTRAGAVQLLTVQVIVVSTFVLRLLDSLSADATVSVLSGIAGYVLGNYTRTSPPPGRAEPNEAPRP
jgi:hypothetical protein